MLLYMLQTYSIIRKLGQTPLILETETSVIKMYKSNKEFYVHVKTM